MKKLSVILVAFALLMGTTAFAASTSVATYKSSIAQEIENLLQKHDFALEHDVMATVTFVVNEKNEIVVLNVDSKESSIIRFIRGRLNYEKLESNMTPGKEYTVPVRLLSAE